MASLGNAARKGAAVRSQQPLPAVRIAGGSTFRELPNWASALIQDELNVKRVEYAQELTEAVQINGESPKAHRTLGSLLARIGHREEAIAHLTEALRLMPDYNDAKQQLRELGAPAPQ